MSDEGKIALVVIFNSLFDIIFLNFNFYSLEIVKIAYIDKFSVSILWLDF